jgi:hypothetical protein
MPKAKPKGAYVRLRPTDMADAKRAARDKRLPVSTWMRAVIMAELWRLGKERADGK